MGHDDPATGRALCLAERDWLAAVAADLADDAPKLIYADWLEERGDGRAGFLRAFVEASGTMNAGDFPTPEGLPGEWLDLIGYRLLQPVAQAGFRELKAPLLRLARPALRMVKTDAGDGEVPVGASKIGGLPDVPPGFAWPKGDACRAIYNDDTAGETRLAGFLAQINLAEIAGSLAARDLPETGLLSFFGFQDIENDHPDEIGVMAVLFDNLDGLARIEPPERLTEGNEVIPTSRLTFEQTLDLPEDYGGPWTEDYPPDPDRRMGRVISDLRDANFENLLGYARATSGDDPTPSRDFRHLILLENAVECRLHIQIHRDHLAARAFDQITLQWVDFD